MTQKAEKKLEFVSEEKKAAYIKEIIAFFQDKRDEEIGFVAAEQILDFFLQTIGEDIYKKAVKDARILIKEKLDDLDMELDLLSGE